MAAIKAEFADFKLVKTRKVAQFVFEVPVEMADAGLTALGGLPKFGKNQWVGIAPIQADAAPQPERKLKTLPQMAGILCQDQRFWEFVGVSGIEGAAKELRSICGVTSRADIREGTEAGDKFNAIRTDFDVFTGRIAGPR